MPSHGRGAGYEVGVQLPVVQIPDGRLAQSKGSSLRANFICKLCNRTCVLFPVHLTPSDSTTSTAATTTTTTASSYSYSCSPTTPATTTFTATNTYTTATSSTTAKPNEGTTMSDPVESLLPSGPRPCRRKCPCSTYSASRCSRWRPRNVALFGGWWFGGLTSFWQRCRG